MTKQEILFTSILGPYGVDSNRSRFKNPMSLLSNQVTRGQEYYTVQMCQRTFAFDLFGVNLNANVTILDFPREKHLRAMLKANKWDRIGVASIVANFESLIKTYSVIRDVLPDVPIDIGGHIANDDTVLLELAERLLSLTPKETFEVWYPHWEKPYTQTGNSPLLKFFAEKKLKGPGVTFVRRDGLEYYSSLAGVGLKNNDVIHAPLVDASFGKRVMGIPVPSTSAGLLIPDVGCPMKCNFCATSHKFNGRFVQYLKTAEDIFEVANAHADRGRPDMFVMSENFSLDTNRALKLLDLMETHKRPHKFSVFSSANGLLKLGVENIVKLGYSFIWIGLEESTGTTYNKMHGIDLKKLISDLQAHGVEVLGSTILGFEHQDWPDLDREIEHALKYECVYNQFMLYMAGPGTALWDEMKAKNKIKRIDWPDFHGQSLQSCHHPRLDPEKLEKKLDEAFVLDFEALGPSLLRMMKVHYNGYVNTESWSSAIVQIRRQNMKSTFLQYAPLLQAMAWDLKRRHHCKADEAFELLEKMIKATGAKGWLAAKAGGPIAYAALLGERYRYWRSQKKRIAQNPKTLVTNYGNSKYILPFFMPKPQNTPGSVAITRPHASVFTKNQKPMHEELTQAIAV